MRCVAFTPSLLDDTARCSIADLLQFTLYSPTEEQRHGAFVLGQSKVPQIRFTVGPATGKVVEHGNRAPCVQVGQLSNCSSAVIGQARSMRAVGPATLSTRRYRSA